MKFLTALAALCVLFNIIYASDNIEEDSKLTAPELVEKYGYPIENHYVTTTDGYILNLQRIPFGKNGNINEKGIPVMLQHGLIASSADWVLAGPEKGFAYILADAGYDVWMGNARGNRYSRNHTTLDPDSDAKKFWDFSWHEIGIYDIPEMIDYILENTGHSDLYHIGHSQGTTSFYVMCSEKPEYNQKIKAHFSLAPIAFMNHLVSPLIRFLALFQGGLGALSNLVGAYEFNPSDGLLEIVTQKVCEEGIPQIACKNTMFVLAGYNKDQMNTTLLPLITSHYPSSSATKQVLHYCQEMNSGYFRQYDHGLISNKKRYGSISPPDYKLHKISAPVYLLYSLNDWMSAEKDVNRLYDQLFNVPVKKIVDPNFNHIDYLWGIDAKTIVYDVVIGYMNDLLDL
ncbi:PREDICTED: lipase 3-like [Nicrophorus vespilloides]|uniref:Lipase n=1 Tax=Nicrophorus vespilloides TaxID=110193 RepID=A0ABM1N3Z0_NICVS|nr:PREDICTED: lipase 3-like [Nicrophorus vespilloides]